MEEIANKILQEMKENLNEINAQTVIQRAEMGYQIAKRAVQKLNLAVMGYQFQSSEEEIRYFKHIRPKLLRELIYYTELYDLEALKPLGDNKAIKHYLKRAVMQFRQYFNRNQSFYNYCRTGKAYMDHLYFVRDEEAAAYGPLCIQ